MFLLDRPPKHLHLPSSATCMELELRSIRVSTTRIIATRKYLVFDDEEIYTVLVTDVGKARLTDKFLVKYLLRSKKREADLNKPFYSRVVVGTSSKGNVPSRPSCYEIVNIGFLDRLILRYVVNNRKNVLAAILVFEY